MLPRPARLCRPRRSPQPAPQKTPASRRRKANTRERQVRTRLVWGFSCQAVVFGFCSQFFVRSGKGRSSFFNRDAGVKRVLSASGLRRIVVQHAGGTSLAKCCFFVRLRAVSSSRPVNRHAKRTSHRRVTIQPPSSRFSKSISHQHVLEPELRTKKGAHDFAQPLLTKAAERLRRGDYYCLRLGAHLSWVGDLGGLVGRNRLPRNARHRVSCWPASRSSGNRFRATNR